MELLKLTPQTPQTPLTPQTPQTPPTPPTPQTPSLQGKEAAVDQGGILEGDGRGCQPLHLQLQAEITGEF